MFSCVFAAFFTRIYAQDDQKKNFKHRFTTFHLETRAAFEYDYEKLGFISGYSSQLDYSSMKNNYGFHGDYFNFLLGGEIGDHISYFIRQRIIPKPGAVSFFDNTDFLYLQYRFNKNWALRVGKEALYVGGFEYDAAPIDVYYFTDYWAAFPCFHIGFSAAYTDNSGKNKIVLQVANSPYVQYTASDWKKGLLSYNLFWSGTFGPFSTLYSVNMMEYERGKFINYIALGNKLTFPKWSIYVDYTNRAVVNRSKTLTNFFGDFSLVSRLDWHVSKSVNLFAKGGYEQNFAENFNTKNPVDMMMPPESAHAFYGLGIEVRPRTYRDLRIHAFFAHDSRMVRTVCEHYPYYNSVHVYDMTTNWNWMANVGVSWRLDFMKFLPEKLK